MPTTITPESISTLRSLFETELTQNPTLYHPTDISRMRTDDWTIKRFLLRASRESKDDSTLHQRAFDALLRTLRWKCAYGVHDRTDAYFPLEWWTMTRAEIVGTDRDGHLIQWGITRNLVKFKHPQARKLTEQFIVHVLEKLDAQAGETGYIMVGNTAETGLANVDLDMVKFVFSIIEHFPYGLKGAYSVDLPWILNSISKLVMTIMPAYVKSLLHFINASELPQYVEEQYIPVGMKGERVREEIPKSVPVAERYLELGLDEAFLKSTRKTMEKFS